MIHINRIEEHLDSQGHHELFVSGDTTDPLTGDSVVFAGWVQGASYIRYQSGDPLTEIIKPMAERRIVAYRQEQGQDVIRLSEIKAAKDNLHLKNPLAMTFITRSSEGEIVEINVPEQTPVLLPVGYEVIAQFPTGVI